MSNGKRKPSLDLQVCYSGFKVEELEYIGYSRTNEDQEDDFLDTFNGKLDDAGVSSGDEEDVEQMLDLGEYGSTSFSTDGYRSYLCSTPTAGRKHRGSFAQDVDMSGFTEPEYARNYPTNVLDSGLQSQTISAANSLISIFGDQNALRAGGSLESLPGSARAFAKPASVRKKIELDSDLNDPYGNLDELELSIEEEMSHISHGNTSTLGTLKRRLSLKVFRRNVSTGLFGSYLQRVPAPALPPASTPTNNQTTMTSDHAALLNNKPTGPINIWFRKFRNRHFI